MPISIAPMPSMASAGRMVAVFGAIMPSASASEGVMDGSAGPTSPPAIRASGRAPLGEVPGPEPLGAIAPDASRRGVVESAGAMSVESDIIVSANGAPAAGGVNAIAAAWRKGITAAMSPAKSPPPRAFAIRLSSLPAAAHWHWSCAYSCGTGAKRRPTVVARKQNADPRRNDIKTLKRCIGTLHSWQRLRSLRHGYGFGRGWSIAESANNITLLALF